MSALTLERELFCERPMVVVTSEDAAAIAVEGEGYAKAAEQAVEQAEVAFRRFGGEELGGRDFAGGIVLHAQSGETRATAFEPVVRGAVELHRSPSRAERTRRWR